MVGGYGVAEDGEDASAGDVGDGRGGHGHAVEVGRLADVGRIGLPLVDVAGRKAEALPTGVALGHCGVFLAEAFARNGALDSGGDLSLCGPDVAEVDGLAGWVVAERVGVEVVADAAGERVGDDERRAHEVVGADVDINSPLEVAIAAEHADGNEAVVFYRFRNVGG